MWPLSHNLPRALRNKWNWSTLTQCQVLCPALVTMFHSIDLCPHRCALPHTASRLPKNIVRHHLLHFTWTQSCGGRRFPINIAELTSHWFRMKWSALLVIHSEDFISRLPQRVKHQPALCCPCANPTRRELAALPSSLRSHIAIWW